MRTIGTVGLALLCMAGPLLGTCGREDAVPSVVTLEICVTEEDPCSGDKDVVSRSVLAAEVGESTSCHCGGRFAVSVAGDRVEFVPYGTQVGVLVSDVRNGKISVNAEFGYSWPTEPRAGLALIRKVSRRIQGLWTVGETARITVPSSWGRDYHFDVKVKRAE